ncbi:MAG: DUF952 domain-containing protein [Acidobacteria bacterium]|nr:DUF952 domain-containing protein [Acidobacteriota bacterium]
MAIIFHIAARAEWDRGEAEGAYRTASLAAEGFIHCSTREQVARVAETRFRGRQDLILLSIDSDRVGAEIRYENTEGGRELFPHIYGELNADAVVRAAEIEIPESGDFTLPLDSEGAEGRRLH